jgi:hypothetical protein
MGTTTPRRYRIDQGKACIDIKVRSARQLFDGRDPAPFRERDLDEDAVEYVLGAVQDLPPRSDVKLVIWIAEEPTELLTVATIEQAVRAHFGHVVESLERRTRQHVRQGQVALLVGLSVLAVFLSLAELTPMLPSGHLGPIVREGLVITGWVAMWRPLELLLYDWWPLVRQRRDAARILGAEVVVIHGHEDSPSTRPASPP